MHAFQPDLGKLMRFASRERLLPPSGDLGYVLHAALAGSFGDAAPKPFVWCPPGTRNGGTGGRLLCYSRKSLEELIGIASAFAEPTVAALLHLSTAESKSMPDHFAKDSRLGFRVRVRPIVRTGKARNGTGGKERDAFIDGSSGTENSDGRARCYLRWLDRRLRAGGATLDHGQLDAFMLTRLMTRDRSGDKSRRSAPIGPDAVANGTLIVNDPERFAELLARGVGRFRAFGFGMLLLSPAPRVSH